VIEGTTGLFFDTQTPETLASLLRSFDSCSFDSERIRAHALQFRVEEFQSTIASHIASLV